MAAQPSLPEPAVYYHVPSDLLSYAEASLRIGVSVEGIKRWVRLGLIPSYQLISGQLRVSLADMVKARPLRIPPERNVVRTDDGVKVLIDPRPAYKYRAKPPSKPASESEKKS